MSAAHAVSLRDLSFSYDSAQQSLLQNLTVTLKPGFTGVIGANGCGKTTLLRLLTGQLQPNGGAIEGITDSADVVYCEQRTDAPPARFAEFLDDWDGTAFELRGRLGVEPEFLERWATLSHGERKRAQIGCALWQQPTLLAIDEPTNHIDGEARELLQSALARFRGIGVIVSHDRALLDALCQQCVWLEPPVAQVYPGGFTQAAEQRLLQRTSAQRERAHAVRAGKALQREVVRRREVASRADSARSKRGLGARDSDAREKIDRARVTGKDGQAGHLLRQLDGRANASAARVAGTQVAKEYETGIWLQGSVSRRDHLFSLAPGELELGEERVLRHPRLTMQPQDRVALTGPNGAGKSTLIAHILRHLNVPEERLIHLPQEIPAADAADILARVRDLPKAELGHVMNIVSRLGSRPDRLLDSRLPSPGEVRKLLLALGMAREPHLIVLDEPTNHLDLPSIEALEDALADCPCGLLLVSHDERFLTRLAHSWWRVDTSDAALSVVYPQP